MREIKFRMWTGQRYIYDQNIVFDCMRQQYSGLYDHVKLHESDFEQFTGLYDKNGKEIYEGDIVKYEADKESGIAIIEYWPGSFIFNWIKQTTPSPSIIGSAFYFGCHSELEVIGNIHENPELRKQEERDE